MRSVELEPSPCVQLLGDAALLRGPAALDVYRVLTEGIAVVQRRDGISPSPRLLQAVAALKAAAHVRSDMADVRKQPVLTSSIKTGEEVGIEEVARMFGVGHRQARRLAPSLGGRRTSKGWKFDRGLVQAYIDMEKSA